MCPKQMVRFVTVEEFLHQCLLTQNITDTGITVYKQLTPLGLVARNLSGILSIMLMNTINNLIMIRLPS